MGRGGGWERRPTVPPGGSDGHLASDRGDAAAALQQSLTEIFMFLVPGQFQSRFSRWVIRRGRYFEPPDGFELAAPTQHGRRAAGWRLGVVFHTAPLTDRTTVFFINTERPADLVLGVAVSLAWIAISFAFLAGHTEGAGEWVLYGGSGPIGVWAHGLRRGQRSVLGLVGTLGATLGVGFAVG